MYVAVEHRISDPESFWGKAQELVPSLPQGIQLHHCMPTRDGTRGICIWEGESVEKIETFLEGHMRQFSNNEYFEVENKDSIALPSGVGSGATAKG
ncbi:MAG TPA: hypothetical protein VM166_06310 [Gemmatimonadaceae bacterium]|nr:hypothetical protein [Gemmatimonadaceae bacterium]